MDPNLRKIINLSKKLTFCNMQEYFQILNEIEALYNDSISYGHIEQEKQITDLKIENFINKLKNVQS